LPESVDNIDDFYDIIEIKNNNFLITNNNTNKIYSKYKLSHKKYKIVLPHELTSIDDTSITEFLNKYKRRINRFYDLDTLIDTELIFIRLGTGKDIKHLDKLNEVLTKYFKKYKLKFINSSELSKTVKTSNWKRDEYDWENLFKVL